MSKVKITLYGGVNEIGGNKFLVEDGDDRILLDFGTSIGARNLFLETPFLEPRTNSALRDLFRLGLLPDVPGIYRDDYLRIAKSATDKELPESAAEWRRRNGGKNFAQALLLTHAHVDHFQDITFLDPTIPIYCTQTTRAMLEIMEKMKNADVESEICRVRERRLGTTSEKTALGAGRPVIEYDEKERAFETIDEMHPTMVGNFRVLAIPVDHSVPGCVAFHIKTPSGKTILYTGDIRFHGNLMDRTALLIKTFEGAEPDVLLSEGTRMDSDSTDAETDVERSLTEIVGETKGLAVAEFAWKDTTRFDTIQRVAKATGRTLLVDPRLAGLVRHLEGKPGVPSQAIEKYGHVKTYVRRRKDLLDEVDDYTRFEAGYRFGWGLKDLAKAMKDKDEAFLAEALAHHRHGVRAAKVIENPEKYFVHLTFWSSFELLDLAPPTRSSWIRCQTEPYNDEMAFTLDRQRRWLDQFGLAHNLSAQGDGDDGILRTKNRVTHVSGHGAGTDIAKLIRSTRASVLVPVHTSEKNLDRFDGLAKDVRTFKGATYASAARGRCVVEL